MARIKSPFGSFKPVKPPKPKAYPGPPPVDKPAAIKLGTGRESPGSRPVTQTAPPPVVQPGTDVSWQDSTYNDTKTAVDKRLKILKGYLVDQGNELGLNTGIEFDRDPNDPLKGSNFRIAENVDVTNPYSTAALLKRTHDQNARGLTTGYAAAGQLYSGALQNAQNSETFNYGAGQNQLLKGFASSFGGLGQQYLSARDTGATDLLTAQGQAIERHKGDPAPPPAFNVGGAPAPGTTPTQYGDLPQTGSQPREVLSQAVRDYIAAANRTRAGKSRKPGKGAGRTGGARAPGG